MDNVASLHVKHNRVRSYENAFSIEKRQEKQLATQISHVIHPLPLVIQTERCCYRLGLKVASFSTAIATDSSCTERVVESAGQQP